MLALYLLVASALLGRVDIRETMRACQTYRFEMTNGKRSMPS